MIVGIIGAGAIGTQIARVAVRAGHHVILSNSRAPDSLREVVREIGQTAMAATPAEAAASADVVVVAIQFDKREWLPVNELVGKIVIDTSTYYASRGGMVLAIDSGRTTSSEIIQSLLPRSHVVKAFSHIGAADITADARSDRTGRRALAITGDDGASKSVVANLLDDFGFDVVDAGALREGWRYDPLTPASGPWADKKLLGEMLAAAESHQSF
jgi:8-hydroxy-5-deazaflavin:NADPH oxidoreductase